ncbi:MAG: hypothetical protein ACO23K_01265 [Ilumatobacteraceae bacterium]
MAYLPDIPGQKEIASFPWHAVKNDVIASKTQPGDLVIPKQVLDSNPDIATLAQAAILQKGGLPSNYIAGDPNGMYNPYTGEQHFGWFDSIVRIAAPIVGFALGGPAGAAAASAVATKATGGSWEEAALSAGTSYIGASMSAPSAGGTSAAATNAGTQAATQAATSATSDALANAAIQKAAESTASATLGQKLAEWGAGEGLSATLAKGATNVINWLPDASVKTVMGNTMGQLGSVALNTQLASGIGALAMNMGAEKAADQYEQAMKNSVNLPGSATPRALPGATAMNFLPFSEAINSTSAGGVIGGAAPYASGASITGIPGVNMLNEVKNRDTGAISYQSTPYDSGSFSNSLSRGRRTGWGQNVVYA